MQSIARCGSEEQKERWLPPMARLEKIGAFALTEPDHGSDSVALETSATRDGDSWVIKHMADVEAVHTFEGTETMQTLIVGRDITGIGAFT